MDHSAAFLNDVNLSVREVTDTTITLGPSAPGVHDGSDADRDYLAMVFGNVPGVVDIGSYVGTNATNPIDCGFTTGTRFVMVKNVTQSGSWRVHNVTDGLTDASGGTSRQFDLNNAGQVNNDLFSTDNGFEVQATTGNDYNRLGDSYIYMAISNNSSTDLPSGTTVDARTVADELQFAPPTDLSTDLKTELFAVGDTVRQDTSFLAVTDNVTSVTTIGSGTRPTGKFQHNHCDF